jgi:two-component system nitrate/nitrite response regulator NarL
MTEVVARFASIRPDQARVVRQYSPDLHHRGPAVHAGAAGRTGMKVMFCDDRELFVDAIASVLRDRGHEVGTTCDPDELAGRVAADAPDVCVLESTVAGLNGTAVAAGVRERCPDAVIVMLTGDVTTDVWAAYDAELVNGVVSKSQGLEQLERALVRAAAGERVLEGCTRPYKQTQPRSPVEPLTNRELEVLRCIVDGDSTEAMSESLGVSRNTVRTHVQHLLRKLGVHERSKAVRLALDLGLVEQPGGAARVG